jgi:hypothetical protein
VTARSLAHPMRWADLERCVAWFLRLLDNYTLGASAEPWTSGLQRWTEPAGRRYHHVERAAGDAGTFTDAAPAQLVNA